MVIWMLLLSCAVDPWQQGTWEQIYSLDAQGQRHESSPGQRMMIGPEQCQIGKGTPVNCQVQGSGESRTLLLIRGGPQRWILERQQDGTVQMDRGDRVFGFERVR